MSKQLTYDKLNLPWHAKKCEKDSFLWGAYDMNNKPMACFESEELAQLVVKCVNTSLEVDVKVQYSVDEIAKMAEYQNP